MIARLVSNAAFEDCSSDNDLQVYNLMESGGQWEGEE